MSPKKCDFSLTDRIFSKQGDRKILGINARDIYLFFLAFFKLTSPYLGMQNVSKSVITSIIIFPTL